MSAQECRGMLRARRYVRRMGLVAFAAMAGSGCGGSGSAPAGPTASPTPTAARKPNIVFILADDLDARAYVLMPRLASLLSARGLTFTGAYVTQSLCCPSRASILTGQYPHNHGVKFNSPPDGGFETFFTSGMENSTFAVWLKSAGYKTALLGKYLNGYPGQFDPTHIPPGWDEWSVALSSQETSVYFDYSVNENGRITRYGSRQEDYETDVLSRKAVAFIKAAAANPQQPFLLYIAPGAPHTPAVFAERHETLHRDALAPRVPSFDENDVSDKPEWVREHEPLSARELRRLDQLYRGRLLTLLAVDEMIEELVGVLEASKQLDNTYIFFTSDNGFQLGEHRIPRGKDTAYEESILVPLIVRGPNVPPGRSLPHFVLNIDFAPTFAQLAGLSAPDSVDGRSFVPLLGSSPPPLESWRKDFLVEHFGRGRGRDDIPAYEALRTADYLYVEYVTGETELYRMRFDPYQLDSMHGPAQASLIDTLSHRVAALSKCRGATCRP